MRAIGPQGLTAPSHPKVDRSFEIEITAEEAQRQVNRWLLNEVSYLIGADTLTLVVGDERVVWRVPAWIGFPHTGRVGTVGTVDVDVETGQMDNTPECKTNIEYQAQLLAERQPLITPKKFRQNIWRKMYRLRQRYISSTRGE